MSGYSRITITGPQRWADLALPWTVPVATLMPRIIEACGSEEEGSDPATWTLTTIDGDPVALEEPLESAGVYDGDVLLLNRLEAPKRPRHVDDVRGAVEDEVDETAWIWNHTTTLSFGLIISAVVPLLMLLLMMWLRPSLGHVGVAVLGTVFSLAVMFYAAKRPLPVVAHILFSTSCLWGATAAILAGRSLTGADWLVLAAFGLAGGLLIALVGWSLDRTGLAYIAGLGVLSMGAAVLVTVGLFVDPVQGARSMALALALCVGALPRAAMVMGGLSGLDYEVGRSGQVETERFEDTYSNSDRLLLGIVTGTGVSAALTLLLLAYLAVGLPDLLLCALLSLLMVLRSRLFDRIRHVLPLRVAGIVGIGAAGVATIGQYPVLGPWLPGVVLLLGMVLGVLSGIRLADVPRASFRRILNWTEIIVIISLLPIFAWSMGLFEFVAIRTGAV